MGIFLRPILATLCVPALLLVLLWEANAVGSLATGAPALLLSVGLLGLAACLLSTGVLLAGRARA